MEKKIYELERPFLKDLNRARGLGPPDFFPQASKQPEDELSTDTVRKGYQHPVSVENEVMGSMSEYFCSKICHDEFPAKLTANYNKLCQLKRSLNQVQDVPPGDMAFSPIWKPEIMNKWLLDLSRTDVPLNQLARKLPKLKKENLFETLYKDKVPMLRACWLMKITFINELNTSRQVNKKNPHTLLKEWTTTFTQYLKTQLSEFHGKGDIGSKGEEREVAAIDKWMYCTRFLEWEYHHGLLDRQILLTWFVEQLQSCTARQASFLSSVLILYLQEFQKSHALVRSLIVCASSKLRQFYGDGIELETTLNMDSPSYMISLYRLLALIIQYFVLFCCEAMVGLPSTVFQTISKCIGSNSSVPGFLRPHTRSFCRLQFSQNSNFVWKRRHAFEALRDASFNQKFHMITVLSLLDEYPFSVCGKFGDIKQIFEIFMGKKPVPIANGGESEGPQGGTSASNGAAGSATVSSIPEAADKPSFAVQSGEDNSDGVDSSVDLVEVDLEKAIRIFCVWAIDVDKGGPHRIFTAVSLLKFLSVDLAKSQRQSFPLQGALFTLLDNFTFALEAEIADRQYDQLIFLIGELIRSRVFCHDRYIKTAICKGKLEVDGGANNENHLKFVTDFPVYKGRLSDKNQRNCVLEGAGIIEDEELISKLYSGTSIFVNDLVMASEGEHSPVCLLKPEKSVSVYFTTDTSHRSATSATLTSVESLVDELSVIRRYEFSEWLSDCIKANVHSFHKALHEANAAQDKVVEIPACLTSVQLAVCMNLISVCKDYYTLYTLCGWLLSRNALSRDHYRIVLSVLLEHNLCVACLKPLYFNILSSLHLLLENKASDHLRRELLLYVKVNEKVIRQNSDLCEKIKLDDRLEEYDAFRNANAWKDMAIQETGSELVLENLSSQDICAKIKEGELTATVFISLICDCISDFGNITILLEEKRKKMAHYLKTCVEVDVTYPLNSAVVSIFRNRFSVRSPSFATSDLVCFMAALISNGIVSINDALEHVALFSVQGFGECCANFEETKKNVPYLTSAEARTRLLNLFLLLRFLCISDCGLNSSVSLAVDSSSLERYQIIFLSAYRPYMKLKSVSDIIMEVMALKSCIAQNDDLNCVLESALKSAKVKRKSGKKARRGRLASAASISPVATPGVSSSNNTMCTKIETLISEILAESWLKCRYIACGLNLYDQHLLPYHKSGHVTMAELRWVFNKLSSPFVESKVIAVSDSKPDSSCAYREVVKDIFAKLTCWNVTACAVELQLFMDESQETSGDFNASNKSIAEEIAKQVLLKLVEFSIDDTSNFLSSEPVLNTMVPWLSDTVKDYVIVLACQILEQTCWWKALLFESIVKVCDPDSQQYLGKTEVYMKKCKKMTFRSRYFDLNNNFLSFVKTCLKDNGAKSMTFLESLLKQLDIFSNQPWGKMEKNFYVHSGDSTPKEAESNGGEEGSHSRKSSSGAQSGRSTPMNVGGTNNGSLRGIGGGERAHCTVLTSYEDLFFVYCLRMSLYLRLLFVGGMLSEILQNKVDCKYSQWIIVLLKLLKCKFVAFDMQIKNESFDSSIDEVKSESAGYSGGDGGDSQEPNDYELCGPSISSVMGNSCGLLSILQSSGKCLDIPDLVLDLLSVLMVIGFDQNDRKGLFIQHINRELNELTPYWRSRCETLLPIAPFMCEVFSVAVPEEPHFSERYYEHYKRNTQRLIRNEQVRATSPVPVNFMPPESLEKNEDIIGSPLKLGHNETLADKVDVTISAVSAKDATERHQGVGSEAADSIAGGGDNSSVKKSEMGENVSSPLPEALSAAGSRKHSVTDEKGGGISIASSVKSSSIPAKQDALVYKVKPWDILEDQKSQSPLSWSWFHATKIDKTELKYRSQFRKYQLHHHRPIQMNAASIIQDAKEKLTRASISASNLGQTKSAFSFLNKNTISGSSSSNPVLANESGSRPRKTTIELKGESSSAVDSKKRKNGRGVNEVIDVENYQPAKMRKT
eukprot:Nk52_evm111s352 gene=Nk52_evmTU111s352